ncbi:hypothetical protein Tco_1563586 [Tanacetum coccineum]
MEREIKRLKRSRIPLVKVHWNSKRGPEFTWEREDLFKQKYPQLFTNRASSSTTRSIRHEVPRYIGGHSLESHYELINALRYSIFRCHPDLGVLQIGIRAKVIENQQSCLLHHLRLPTLSSIPTLSQGVYFGEPMRRFLMEPHDPDYVPKPIYPEYIPLEDEHVFLVEEQPLPPVDSPTAESPRYVAESDPEEDPEEYEDDESDLEDCPVNYPIDRGEDGYDDDGDSFGDDANDEDEDEEEEEEEEHLAPTDSAIVVPTVELVSPPEGIEPVTPPPSTDITTTGARITVQL